MAAHSSCDFGGGKAERLALAKYRQVLWQGRVLNSQFTDEALRKQGRCPLTPEEIGLLLAALGFSNSTRLYLASHKASTAPSLLEIGKLYIYFRAHNLVLYVGYQLPCRNNTLCSPVRI